MDDMRCIAACLPRITLYEFPAAHLRPQAPQPPTTIFLIFSLRLDKAIEEKPSIFTIFFLHFHDAGHKHLTLVVLSL